MKRHYLRIYLIMLATTIPALHASSSQCPTNCFNSSSSECIIEGVGRINGRTFLTPRSQSENTAREFAGWTPFINKYDEHHVYGTWSITPEYTHSFKAQRLAHYFFSTDVLNISGSQVIGRGDQDLLADYFGLAPNFESTVIVEPIMQNILAECAGYIGWRNFYLRLHTAVAQARTYMKLSENIVNNGVGAEFPPEYMDVDAVTPPYTSFKQAVRGGGISYGQVEPLQYGLFCCDTQKHTALADIHIIAGWNCFNRERGAMGLYVKTVIPTGNRPNNRCIFEPTVGNGHHWEFGLGFSGHGLVWEKDAEQEINFVVDFHVTHLFKSGQRRSFDLMPNGLNSRYILAKQFDADQGYTNITLPMINATTLCCNVEMHYQAEGIAMFSYQYKNFGFDFGYNAWLRSPEKITDIEQLPYNTYGLKGIQNVSIGDIPSNATQHLATIQGNEFTEQAVVADINPPVFTNASNIYPKSGANSSTVTHKFFWNFNFLHTLTHHPSKQAYVGLGAEVEFEGRWLPPLQQCDTHPNDIAMSQWGVWIKGGIGF
jgi:hypothetical protein